MKCESAHIIVQVWRAFDSNSDIQYRIDEEHQRVFLRMRYAGKIFMYVCSGDSASLDVNHTHYTKKPTFLILKATESELSGGAYGRFYNAINVVPMRRYPIPGPKASHKKIIKKLSKAPSVPIDKHPICMNCAYFSHCNTSGKRVGCAGFVLK